MITTLLKEPKTKGLYSHQELSLLNRRCVPKHVAIVMDGNRRWAKRQGLPPVTGHWRGAEAVTTIVEAACELGIEVLTLYSFSTENWNRTKVEIKSVMRLLKTYLLRQTSIMVESGVRLNVIGDISRFPPDIQNTFAESMEATRAGKRLDLVLALSYGARDEMKRAIQKMAKECVEKKLSPDQITEETISRYLDTAKWQDPDLLIRSSGEHRISNFLLWQISYTEIYFTDILWPDFCEKQLLHAILDYQTRERRLGGDETRSIF